MFKMHVNFTSVEVNQLREEAIPMHQQGTHLDLPGYTEKMVVSKTRNGVTA